MTNTTRSDRAFNLLVYVLLVIVSVTLIVQIVTENDRVKQVEDVQLPTLSECDRPILVPTDCPVRPPRLP